MAKRKDYLSWDDTFMSIAKVISQRSKDPSTQVGACIVNKDNRVVSLGYNGFPNDCPDDVFPWEKPEDGGKNGGKYLFVVHAELNAILNAKRDLSDCVLFVTHFPCNECAKAIIQSGIKTVYYENFYEKGSEATIQMFRSAKVEFRKLESTVDIKMIPKSNTEHWIDNADSYICPSCGYEVNDPGKTNNICPKCGWRE